MNRYFPLNHGSEGFKLMAYEEICKKFLLCRTRLIDDLTVDKKKRPALTVENHFAHDMLSYLMNTSDMIRGELNERYFY